MKIVIIIFVLIAIAFTSLLYFGKKHYKHKNVSQKDLARYLEALLERGLNGGFLVIEVPNNKLFIQFSKYFIKNGQAGLQFDFPMAPWSEKYFEQLKRELLKMNLDFSIVSASGVKSRKFIAVDLKRDINSAASFATFVLQSIFGLTKEQTLTLYFENISPKDEKIA
jgi:hypothetical protein